MPVIAHLIDDSCNASIIFAAVNLINSVDRCLGGIAYSYHEGNPFPDDLSSVVIVLVSPSLSSCEQLGSLSAPDPKLVLLPKRMEIAGKRQHRGMPTSFSALLLLLLLLLSFAFVRRRAGWIAIRRIELLSMPKFRFSLSCSSFMML